MKVNGYQLREAMKRWQTRKEIAAKKFPESLRKFADEDKKPPMEVLAEFKAAENAIATLQTAQQWYNLQVEVTQGMTLALAVKRLGGASRAEKILKDALGIKTRDAFDYLEGRTSRDRDSEYAERTITDDELRNELEAATSETSELREAIATANATMFEFVEDLSELIK